MKQGSKRRVKERKEEQTVFRERSIGKKKLEGRRSERGGENEEDIHREKEVESARSEGVQRIREILDEGKERIGYG